MVRTGPEVQTTLEWMVLRTLRTEKPPRTSSMMKKTIGKWHFEKICLLPGCTQTGQYVEVACYFGFYEKRNFTIYMADGCSGT